MADTDDVNHSVTVKLLVNMSKNALQNGDHIQSWTDACSCVFCNMRLDHTYVVLLRENVHSCDSMSKAYEDIKAAVIIVVILANVLSIFQVITLSLPFVVLTELSLPFSSLAVFGSTICHRPRGNWYHSLLGQ